MFWIFVLITVLISVGDISNGNYLYTQPLCENCPNTYFFLVRIFPHLEWIRRDAENLSIFSSNVGKYGPEKTAYLDTFHAVNPRNYLLKHFKSLALFKDWKVVDIKKFFNIRILKGAKFSNFYDPEKTNIDSKRNYTNIYVD